MRLGLGLVLVGCAVTPLGAHEGAHAAAARTGPSAWDAAAMLVLAAAGLLYAAGSRGLARNGARMRRVERGAFWSGLLTLALAVAPPLDGAAARTFSAHMIQHELLMLIGAPLVIVGRPIVPWLWALPMRFRRLAGVALRCTPVTGVWRALTSPVVAWVLHGAAIWIWHAPALYEAAVASEAIHAVQHATFVATAALFWWGLVYGRYGRAAYGAAVLFVFTTMVHTGVLGAIFALSNAPFYDIYRDRAAAAGVDPAVDQQLAGLYMWIPAGIVLTVCGLALLIAWLAEAERRTKHAGSATVLALIVAGTSAAALA
jgi:putative membrane protein